MTGFAVESTDLEAGVLTLELRAVNSRFLDLAFRMGDDFRTLEPVIRERIGDLVRRGKVECRVNFAPREAEQLPGELNTTLLAQLGALSASVRAIIADARPLSVAETLRWPGMMVDSSLPPDRLQTAALTLLDKALRDFQRSRETEGEKLAIGIRQKVAAMRTLVAELRPKSPIIVAAYREKLARRMEEMLLSGEHERIHQEVAFFAQKIDVEEELDRLLVHLGEVERVVTAGGTIGKRLDFLMQELHREANTLGSKSVALELSQSAVELKVLIEQMREQVQNIE